jgi:alpha-amylase
VSGNGDVVNLFMDYETFGEHQWADTGIFEFMRYLPEKILAHSDWNFATPSQVLDRYPARAEMHYHRLTSWADVERDLTAWRGNRMQNSALELVYELGRRLKAKYGDTLDPLVVDAWRKLLTSDHFYYMCTKWFADGDVHAYFSPYESTYEAFINFMNVLRDFRQRWVPEWQPEEPHGIKASS